MLKNIELKHKTHDFAFIYMPEHVEVFMYIMAAASSPAWHMFRRVSFLALPHYVSRINKYFGLLSKFKLIGNSLISFQGFEDDFNVEDDFSRYVCLTFFLVAFSVRPPL